MIDNNNPQPRVYLDTSAYLAILFGERDSFKIIKKIRNTILCSSSLLLLEAERNLIHLVRQKLITPGTFERAILQLKSDRAVFLLRDFTPDLCLSLDFPAVRTPRSSDLAHLRTAKWYLNNGGLLHFLSLDKVQLKAADEMNLPLCLL